MVPLLCVIPLKAGPHVKMPHELQLTDLFRQLVLTLLDLLIKSARQVMLLINADIIICPASGQQLVGT